MTSFSQLGDPVGGDCPPPEPCLCEHHGAAYAEFETSENSYARDIGNHAFATGATIAQVQITTTERCCIVVNAATAGLASPDAALFEIERPVGTARTTQYDSLPCIDVTLMHHAAWEVLDPGTYTYYLVNRAGSDQYISGAWIKAIASDCEA